MRLRDMKCSKTCLVLSYRKETNLGNLVASVSWRPLKIQNGTTERASMWGHCTPAKNSVAPGSSSGELRCGHACWYEGLIFDLRRKLLFGCQMGSIYCLQALDRNLTFDFRKQVEKEGGCN